MSRVPLVKKDHLPEEYEYLFETDSLGERNILQAIGNNPKILQSYMRYGTTLWTESNLSHRERELIILTVASTSRSRYEWQQHVSMGREADISEEEMIVIGRHDFSCFSNRERIVLEYVRRFVEGTVTDDVHTALTEYHDSKVIVGIAALASHYIATAHMLEALAIPLEDEFVGWDLESDG